MILIVILKIATSTLNIHKCLKYSYKIEPDSSEFKLF